jgi:hypothetical protein
MPPLPEIPRRAATNLRMLKPGVPDPQPPRPVPVVGDDLGQLVPADVPWLDCRDGAVLRDRGTAKVEPAMKEHRANTKGLEVAVHVVAQKSRETATAAEELAAAAAPGRAEEQNQ